ncbi:sugar ABC transporter permease, partial [Saccharothrix algeriensis]
YEAAELDGAGRIRQFFSITLPMLSPTAFFITVLTSIGALQVFDVICLDGGRRTAPRCATRRSTRTRRSCSCSTNGRSWTTTRATRRPWRSCCCW